MSEDDPETLRERVRELEQTADDLRETVEQLQQRRGPSRRDLLKVGSGGLLGAGLLASSQPVSAAPASADTSAGQVGVAGDSEDIVLDQAYDPGGDEILNVDDSGGINAQFGRTWYFDSVGIVNATITGDFSIDASVHQDKLISHTLTDGEKSQLDPDGTQQRAIYLYSASATSFGLFGTQGGGLTVSDLGTVGFSTTEDNDSTLNVYYDDGNSRYEINNELGQTVDVALFRLSEGTNLS